MRSGTRTSRSRCGWRAADASRPTFPSDPGPPVTCSRDGRFLSGVTLDAESGLKDGEDATGFKMRRVEGYGVLDASYQGWEADGEGTAGRAWRNGGRCMVQKEKKEKKKIKLLKIMS